MSQDFHRQTVDYSLSAALLSARKVLIVKGMLYIVLCVPGFVFVIKSSPVLHKLSFCSKLRSPLVKLSQNCYLALTNTEITVVLGKNL